MLTENTIKKKKAVRIYDIRFFFSKQTFFILMLPREDKFSIYFNSQAANVQYCTAAAILQSKQHHYVLMLK